MLAMSAAEPFLIQDIKEIQTSRNLRLYHQGENQSLELRLAHHLNEAHGEFGIGAIKQALFEKCVPNRRSELCMDKNTLNAMGVGAG